jgi:hypothetical protein
MSFQSPCMMQFFPTGSGIAARGEVTLLPPEIKGQTSNESIAAAMFHIIIITSSRHQSSHQHQKRKTAPRTRVRSDSQS